MGPEHVRGLIEDALWPQDTKRGHGQSLGTTLNLPLLLPHIIHVISGLFVVVVILFL